MKALLENNEKNTKSIKLLKNTKKKTLNYYVSNSSITHICTFVGVYTTFLYIWKT